MFYGGMKVPTADISANAVSRSVYVAVTYHSYYLMYSMHPKHFTMWYRKLAFWHGLIII